MSCTTATTENRSSNHTQGCLQLANDLILAHRLPVPRVTSLGDLKSSIFVLLFKAICKVQIPELTDNPLTTEEEVHNIQAIIDALSLDILSISLFHITGEDVISQNPRSIYNLLEILNGLSNQVHSIASTVSQRSDIASPVPESPKYHSDSTEQENGICTCLSEDDFREKFPASRSKLSSSVSSSESGSTAECIALGKTRYLCQKYVESFNRYADAAVATSKEKKSQFPSAEAHKVTAKPDTGFCRGDYKYQEDLQAKLKPPSTHASVIIPDVKCLNEGIDFSLALGDTVFSVPKYVLPFQRLGGTATDNIQAYGIESHLVNVLETKEDSSSSSSRLLKYAAESSRNTAIKTAHGLKRKRGYQTHTAGEHASTATIPKTLDLGDDFHVNGIGNSLYLVNDAESAETESSSTHKVSLSQSSLNTDAIDMATGNEAASTSSGKSQTATARTQTEETALIRKHSSRASQTRKPTISLEDVENIYSDNIKHAFSEKIQEAKRIRLQASLMDEKYKSSVNKSSTGSKIGSSKKSFLLPKHLRKRSRGPGTTRRAISLPDVKKSDSGDSLVQRLQKQFPGVQLSPSMLKLMEKKEKQHSEMLEKAAEEILAKRPKTQVLLEKAVEKQKKVSEILKKDAAGHQRHRDLVEHKQQQLELKSLLHRRKVQSARLKRYHADYCTNLRARMRKIRTKEEQIVYKLFEDILKVQTEDLREAQKILKEEEDKDEEFEKNYLQALENFHKDQLDKLKHRLQVQEHSLRKQVKEQSRILQADKRDARHYLEQNVQQVQKQIIDELDDPQLVELQAQRLRERLLLHRKKNVVI